MSAPLLMTSLNRASFPASLKDPVQYMTGHSKGIDADLIVSVSFPPWASILNWRILYHIFV